MTELQQRETNAIERFLLLTFTKRRGMACHTGPHGEAPVSVRKQKEARGKPRLSPSMGKAKQGRVDSLALASSNNSSRPWHIGVVPSCLVLGPGVSSAGEILL